MKEKNHYNEVRKRHFSIRACRNLALPFVLLVLPLGMVAQTDHHPNDRIINTTTTVIDTAKAERLFQPIKDSLLCDYQKGADKQLSIQNLVVSNKKKVKDASDLDRLIQAYIYYKKRHPEFDDNTVSSPKIGIPSLSLGGLVVGALMSHKSTPKLQKNVQKGRLTPDVIQCLKEYNEYLADSLQQVYHNMELGWEYYFSQLGISCPKRERNQLGRNPYYRGSNYDNYDTLDLLEQYQQRKGWEFLYDGTHTYKEDSYPTKFKYYIYDTKPQYKVDCEKLDVYNTSGQLVYVPFLTRKANYEFEEIKRLVYFRDYQNNKYDIKSTSKHTQEVINRYIGEEHGMQNAKEIGIAMAFTLAFATPYSIATGDYVTQQKRKQIIDGYNDEYRDPDGENFIQQLTTDHKSDFGYIYMIERISNLSFRVIYINNVNLQPSWCAIITYRTGETPYTKTFSAKLVDMPVNVPPADRSIANSSTNNNYGTSANVGNRWIIYLAKPAHADPNSEGTVCVSIQVSPSGVVISANVASSTTTSEALKNAALAAAKQSRFSEGDETESGTITYRFKLR